jgi:hypothetical protein
VLRPHPWQGGHRPDGAQDGPLPWLALRVLEPHPIALAKLGDRAIGVSRLSVRPTEGAFWSPTTA